MDPRHEQVTARVIFTGVMFMCINDDQYCEVGMITCPNHTPEIKILKVKNGKPEPPRLLKWSADGDLLFTVNKAEAEGVRTHPGASGPTDFKKVVDLEGPDFHNEKVDLALGKLDKRRIAVTAGKLYTHKLSAKQIKRLIWVKPTDPGSSPKVLGKIADQIGLNIICRNDAGSGIEIKNTATGTVLESLPTEANTWYQIVVDNDCERPKEDAKKKTPAELLTVIKGEPQPDAAKVGSDFRFYYDVITGPGTQKYDLDEHVPVGGRPVLGVGICESGFLGRSDTLGFSG